MLESPAGRFRITPFPTMLYKLSSYFKGQIPNIIFQKPNIKVQISQSLIFSHSPFLLFTLETASCCRLFLSRNVPMSCGRLQISPGLPFSPSPTHIINHYSPSTQLNVSMTYGRLKVLRYIKHFNLL